MKDLVKSTLIKRIEDLKLENLTVNDGHLEEVKPTQRTFPRMLFKDFVNKDKKSIYVVDYERYDKYGKEEIPKIVGDVSGLEVEFDKKVISNVISSYDPTTGVIEFENPISDKTFKFKTEVLIVENVESVGENKVEIYAVSTISTTKNRNITSKLRRYDLVLFTFNDENGDLTNYYIDQIQSTLRRDFLLLDENYEKTKSIVYIEDNCRFDIHDYNKSNRVMRGTVLLKTIV
ncbi:MAG: hypothetical protein ACRDDY_03930 [Clostridium sp.]|uniref:hypothetical protein n=1 Tax=Clostridium sp. TaxID=1506 RepID=UPI003EE511F8